MSSRVFVVQRPAYYDRIKRGWVNKYDLSPAKDHGELVFLLRPGNIRRDRLRSAVQSLREELADYGPGDFLLAIGDPVAIAVAVAVALEASDGIVTLLKWDRMEEQYEPYRIDLNEG